MKSYSNLSDSDGEKLVNTARVVVTEYLKTKNKMKLDSEFMNTFSAILFSTKLVPGHISLGLGWGGVITL